MRKIKYVLKRIKNMQWKNMFDIAKKISKITHKPSAWILIDIVYSALKYGAGYMDYFEFEFYLLNKKERKTFLTSTINNQIIATYNEKKYFENFSNKIKFNQIFQKYLNHDFIDVKNSSFEEFQKFCEKKKTIVGKVVDACGGKGIDFYEINKKNLKQIYETLLAKKQYLVEEVIVQHNKMNELYEKSINTLRIISFLTEDNEVVILNAILRIGNGGKVDNFSSGGMYTFIDDEGKVLLPAIDELGKVYEIHPITNTKIVGFQIPQFEKVKELVQKIAKKIPEVRYVGWDIAVGNDGPILIEGNEFSGVFQMKPSLSKKKEGLIVKYKKYMDIL